MRTILEFLNFCLDFIAAAITSVKTNISPAGAEMDGALMNQGAMVSLFNDLSNNGSPAFGNSGLGIYSGITNTWAAGDMVGGFIRRAGTQSSADFTDTAANILLAIPGAKVNQTFPLVVANLSSLGAITPQAGTGVSLIGTTTIDRLSARLFIGRVTGSNAVSLTSAFQFGGLSANAISF